MGFTVEGKARFAAQGAAVRTEGRSVAVRYRAKGVVAAAAVEVRMTVSGLDVGRSPEPGGYEEEVVGFARLEKVLVGWSPEIGGTLELVESGERYRVVTLRDDSGAEWRMGLGSLLRGR